MVAPERTSLWEVLKVMQCGLGEAGRDQRRAKWAPSCRLLCGPAWLCLVQGTQLLAPVAGVQPLCSRPNLCSLLVSGPVSLTILRVAG